MTRTNCLWSAAAALLLSALPARSELIQDGSFEGPTTGGTPASSRSSMTYAPGGSPWTFNKGAGVQLAAEPDVHMYVPGNRAADGLWVAFLQAEGATISQPFVTPSAGPYRLRYSVAGRDQDPPFGGDTRYEVRINRKRLALEASASHQPWTSRSHDFMVPAGSNLLEFVVVYPTRDSGPRFAGAAFFVDAVSLVSLNPVAASIGAPTQKPAPVVPAGGPPPSDIRESDAPPTAAGAVERAAMNPAPPTSAGGGASGLASSAPRRPGLNWGLLGLALVVAAMLAILIPLLVRRR